MARYRDQAGRPIVAVTGIGVVTSLGIGKADNWQKLMAGQSGIHAITRFATDGLKTRIAGTIDFFLFGSVADGLAERLGTKGSPISLSTACASGASAIQLGIEAIRRGEVEAALCIGTDGS